TIKIQIKMTRIEILDELKKVFAPYTANKEMLNSINEDTDLIIDLKINSANLVDIIIDAEAKYNIEIDYDSADKIINVGTCIDVIMEKLNQNK
ncbi:MAG: acyl carrier protein, partial [Sphingobacteriales bacterium]